MDPWSTLTFLALTSLLLEVTVVLRVGPSLLRGYLVLLLVNLGFLGWIVEGGVFLRPSGGPTVEVLGGLTMAALLLIAPRILRRLSRRALAAEQYHRAARLVALRELLVPGAATTAEREFHEQVARAHDGDVDGAIRALRLRLGEAEPEEAERIHERMITLLVFARRYREATRLYETHLQGALLRSAGLAVQLVRAYGELGEIEAAATLLARMEAAAPGDPAMPSALLQARLHVLAFSGDRAAVERLLAMPALGAMPTAMRDFFRRTATSRAAAAIAPSATPIVEEATATSTPTAAVPELQAFLRDVADRATRDVHAVSLRNAARPRAWVSSALVGANALAYVLFVALVGPPDQVSSLIRGGASFHPAVLDGEWWRLWTAMFLHGGLLHFGFNVLGLYLVGRLVEPMYGALRFLVIYCVAGLAGNLVSVWNPDPRAIFSLGASGAILGILGALMVALVVRRAAWPDEWRRSLLINVQVLLVAQLAIGMKLSMVDNYAHVGGFLGGAGAAWLLLPGGVLGRGALARAVIRVSLALLSASAALAVGSLLRERPTDTVRHLPRKVFVVAGFPIGAPAAGGLVARPDPPDWPGEEELIEGVSGLSVAPHRVPMPAGGIDAALAEAMARDQATMAKGRPEAALRPAEAPAVAGWTARALLEPGSPAILHLYYALPSAATDGGQVLLAELNHEGASVPPDTVEEIARLLGWLRDPEHPPR